MADYDIRIKTTAEGQGAQQTAEGLKQVTAEAKAAAPATEKVTQETERAATSHGKLAAALHRVTHAVPLLGNAVAFLKHPLIGLGAVIASLISWWQKLLAVWKEIENSEGSLAAKLTLLEGRLKGVSGNMRDAKTAANELKAALDAVNKAARDPDKKLGEEGEAIDRKLEREKEILRLRQQKVFATIDADQAKGEINEPEAVKRKADVEMFFLKEEERLEDEARKAKQAVLAKGHMQAQQDFKGALDANQDADRMVKEAKDKLTAFDRGEKGPGGLAETRAARDAELAKQEKEAREEVAGHGTMGRLEWFMSGGGRDYEHSQDAREARAKRLERQRQAQARLDAITAERKGIYDAGQAQEEKRKGLSGELGAAEKFQAETVKAAADAKQRAETTRKGFVDLGLQGTDAAAHSQATSDIRREIAAAQADRAAADQARRDALEFLRQSRQEERELWNQIRGLKEQVKNFHGQ